MEKQNRFLKGLFRLVSYVLVAAIASAATLYWMPAERTDKLDELRTLIDTCFIGEADPVLMEDAAADAMVNALGDRWSYYIPASQYAAYMEQMKNAYVGIGVTIATEPEEEGFKILQVDPSGGAYEAGLLAGDILVAVSGQNVMETGIDATRDLIRGEENTQVEVSVLRDGEMLTVSVPRRTVQVQVANGQLLEGNIGLVRIVNFDERCAQETLAAVEALLEDGAQSLVFDVRFNPGGYKSELVKILDYLLPEGPVFRSMSYTGEESVTNSDANCLDIPMAVLINSESYSAAEFFAAALDEYDKAVLVGEATTGKGYFQNTFQLRDGSAVGLSVGKYFTPNGVSLAETGGLKPEIDVAVDNETAAAIYAGVCQPQDDPQLQAAMAALKTALSR